MAQRTIRRIISAMATSDGAGVKLKRSLGQTPHARLDPFLMLDEFYSNDAADYLAGFPDHPHRGFETVTYMLDGHMLHEDHLGNRGDLHSGGVQWMTAGRGIIHSEMPQQDEGVMRGFQLWINLPATEKMKDADYRDIQADEIPVAELAGGGRAKVIAGRLSLAGEEIEGAVQGSFTEPLYIDLNLAPGERFEATIPASHQAFLYLYEGELEIEGEALQRSSAALLSDGEQLTVTAGSQGAGVLLLAGRPINEPVVQYGPFVMNTREEIEQTLQDYRDGRLTAQGGAPH
jgi:redox-sensitive bicupin YhaK (pirin superfamily)